MIEKKTLSKNPVNSISKSVFNFNHNKYTKCRK